MPAPAIAALAARLLASQAVRQGAKVAATRYGKSAWTIFKRIGARNTRKFFLHDLKGGFEIADAASALTDTASATSWIVRRIITADAAKVARAALLNNTGVGQRIMGSAAMRNAKQLQVAVNARKLSRIQRFQLDDAMRKMNPNLDLKTGEVFAQRNMRLRLQDMHREASLSFLSPQTTRQQIIRGLGEGVFNQFVGTTVFRFIEEQAALNGPAWATKFVQNLDELILPAGSATTAFSRTELAVRLVDVATVTKAGGSFSRFSRVQFARDIRDAASKNSAINFGDVARTYVTPRGVARGVSSLATRSFMINVLNEDEKQQELYVKKAQAKQRHSGKVYVRAHTRNGHHVEAYYRETGV